MRWLLEDHRGCRTSSRRKWECLKLDKRCLNGASRSPKAQRDRSKMIKKEIVVLANSTKHHPMRCVAGRELLRSLGACHWGAWIRPVTTHDEGALRSVERRLADNSDPIPLDVIEIRRASPRSSNERCSSIVGDVTTFRSPTHLSVVNISRFSENR